MILTVASTTKSSRFKSCLYRFITCIYMWKKDDIMNRKEKICIEVIGELLWPISMCQAS